LGRWSVKPPVCRAGSRSDSAWGQGVSAGTNPLLISSTGQQEELLYQNLARAVCSCARGAVSSFPPHCRRGCREVRGKQSPSQCCSSQSLRRYCCKEQIFSSARSSLSACRRSPKSQSICSAVDNSSIFPSTLAIRHRHHYSTAVPRELKPLPR